MDARSGQGTPSESPRGRGRLRQLPPKPSSNTKRPTMPHRRFASTLPATTRPPTPPPRSSGMPPAPVAVAARSKAPDRAQGGRGAVQVTGKLTRRTRRWYRCCEQCRCCEQPGDLPHNPPPGPDTAASAQGFESDMHSSHARGARVSLHTGVIERLIFLDLPAVGSNVLPAALPVDLARALRKQLRLGRARHLRRTFPQASRCFPKFSPRARFICDRRV